MTEFEIELRDRLIARLDLQDVDPAQITSESRLFGADLGLDSIDALELAMVLEEKYGVTIEDDPEGNARIFASVRSLADFVRSQGGEAGGKV